LRHGRSQLRGVARLALVLALLAGACHFGGARSGTAGGQRGHAGGTLGVKGGTLRIASFGDVDSLDPALAYDGFEAVFQRATQRTLLSFDALRPASQQGEPVPDLVDGMPRLSPDRLTYTLKLRSGIQYYAPELPSGRTVEAKDVVNQVERMFDKVNPSGAQQYVRLIRGADEFAAGKALTISGLRADGQTLQITLKQPAADFIPILALPFFSPVPEELSSDHALKPGGRHRVGGDYSAHPAAEGPYYVQRHQAGRSLVLARNPNWDPASDPLRRAWVDRIEMRVGVDADQMELGIERGDVDLQGDTPPPAETLPRIASDPELSQRFALELTGGIRYLALETHPAAGPMANLKVRQAIEFAVDKEAIRRARGG
jgi:peptide/nickel transport system substrate-binding protein